MKGGSGAALALGGFLLLGGYAVASFGWILLKGWDIPFRSWVSPLHPYSWQSGSPSLIPDTQIFPTVGGGIEAGGGPVPGAPAPGAAAAPRGPSPGGAVLA